jgi:hypothetical protein
VNRSLERHIERIPPRPAGASWLSRPPAGKRALGFSYRSNVAIIASG